MKKLKNETKTTEFELEGIEEAHAPAPSHHTVRDPQKAWQPAELPKLQVERPRELEGEHEPEAIVWILERRARGVLGRLKRWLAGKTRR